MSFDHPEVIRKFSHTSLTPAHFSREVNQLVEQKKFTYIDAVLFVCENRGLNPENVADLIGANIRDKLRQEGENLHLLSKSKKLPGY